MSALYNAIIWVMVSFAHCMAVLIGHYMAVSFYIDGCPTQYFDQVSPQTLTWAKRDTWI